MIKIDLNIANHKLSFYYIQPPNSNNEYIYGGFGDYICEKCNAIIYFVDGRYYIMDNLGMNNPFLSCEEVIIKNIIN